MFVDAGSVASRLVFVGCLIEAVEGVRLGSTFGDRGIFSRTVLGLLTSAPGKRRGWTGRLSSILATRGAERAVLVAMTTQAAAATTVLAVGTYAILGKVAVLTCLATGGYLRFRRGIGGNGADQLTFMVLVTFALVLLAGAGPMTQRAGDVFIAAQLCLAYFASGFAKLVSPVWRSGQAIVGILATEGFGMPSVAARLATLRWLAWLMCWTVILWECTFPVVLIAPPPVTLALLAFGVVFHGGCAIAMGLNRFAWAFCGCYSAVLVVTTTNL